MTAEKCPYCFGVVDRTDKTCQHCRKSLTVPGDTIPLPAALPSSTLLLMVLGVLMAALGVLMLSEATRGVGLICAGCFVGIWARILQAGKHHHDTLSR